MSSLLILYFVLALWSGELAYGDDLSSFGIKSYQIIRNIHDQTNAHRHKRSINNNNRILTLELDSKNITLVLQNTKEYFSDDADIHLGSSSFLPINSSILYAGYVWDQPESSYVTGGFHSNSFDGVIQLSNETWHVEPTRRYSPQLIDAGPSIIYNALDVDLAKYQTQRPFRSKRSVEESLFCGLNDQRKREEMNEERDRLSEDDFKLRHTRTKRGSGENPERSCCFLYIRIDPTLWDMVYKNEGLYEKEATIHALVTFLYRTVTAANAIYRSVKFEFQDDHLYRFTLRIKRIRILTYEDCKQANLSLSEANICRPYLDSNVFLTWHSAENFAEYCLAYMFSARDFGDGTLGLAWMGSIATNSRGGICETPAKDIFEGKRVIKTLNTGIITVINHNTRTSALMTELTFAHEVGHSLGAEHDEDSCDGDATYGHYIMYRRATTGLEENNNRFSNCSLGKMGPVVISVKNQLHGKVNCLTECSQLGYCGNRNVEENEECDCGFSSECTDNCCYPAQISNPKLGCKLKPGARCSPSKGPCCSEQCVFHSASHICHKDQASEDCIGDVRCDGIQATCPLNDAQFFKPPDTPCNFNTALCDRGECNKSVCTLIGKSECPLAIANVPEPLRERGIDREYLCHIGCLDSRTNSCVDTHALQMPNNYSKTGLGYIHRPGHACAGTAGYCDVFGKCRTVDAEGPLSRLKNTILSDENIHTLKEIAQEHWWALVLCFLGLMGFMSIFVKICSVHTPSSNPRLKAARAFSLKDQAPRVSRPRASIETDAHASQRMQPKIYLRGQLSSDNRSSASHL